MSKISDLNEEVLGPVACEDDSFYEEESEGETLDPSVVLVAIGKMRALLEDEIREVVQALTDKLMAVTEALERSQTEIKLLKQEHYEQKQLQQEVHHKSLENNYSAGLRVESIQKALQGEMKLLRQDLLDASASHAKATERWLNKKIEGLSGLQGDNLMSLQKAFETGTFAAEERFKSLLSSLPTPQVYNTFSVPESAIKMEQLPAQVHVNVPQQAAPVVENKFQVPDAAFKFHVEQPAPQVFFPEKALQVNVTQAAAPPVVISEKAFSVQVPEQAPPSINVNTPRRKVIKHITYDAMSRPEHIVEEEIMEEDEQKS